MGNLLKVFKHWGEQEEKWIFNNHSCFTAEWTEGLPHRGCRETSQKTGLAAPQFPDNTALLAKTF